MTETPDHILRFGFHEIAFMLAGQDTPSANRTREIMGIVDVNETDGQAYMIAGLSGLSARGFVSEGETPVPTGRAAVVAQTLATATNWTSLYVRTRDEIELSVLVQGASFSLMARQTPGLVTDFTPVKPGVSIAEATLELAVHYLDKLPDVAVIVRSASIDSDAAVSVLRTENQGWQLADNPVFPGDENWPAPDAEGVSVDRATAIAALGELVGRFAVAAQ